ncbi:MAG: hypothetical protein NT145_03995 [Elusimicrobia bacterium]|nr:hypothetical protein [Elusimicrobiota bacterium]
MKKLKIFFTILVIFISCTASFAAITDNSSDLIIPAGETYTKCGAHNYDTSVQIDGTLYVQAYDGTALTGWLTIETPNITIGSTGKIIVDGKGYRGATTAYASEGPGAGGSGGMRGGGGGYGGKGEDASVSGGAPYGSLMNPNDFGSGGGKGQSFCAGGNGGGKIRLKVNGELINNGVISANGTQGTIYDINRGGGGSGGSIYLEAGTISGTGFIQANGGYGAYTDGGGGGSGGRIALYYITDNYNGTVECTGSYNENNGGAGTFYKKDKNQSLGDLFILNGNVKGEKTYIDGQYRDVIIGNNAVVFTTQTLNAQCLNAINKGVLSSYGVTEIADIFISSSSEMCIESGQANMGDIEISSNSIVYMNHQLTANNLRVCSTARITHSQGDADFDLTVSGNLEINEGGKIDVDGCGYRGGAVGINDGNGEGPGGGPSASVAGAGGGYGGKGAKGSVFYWEIAPDGGEPYGNITEPLELGSGGGRSQGFNSYGGNGGGKIKIKVNGTLQNNGIISAGGTSGGYDNGSRGGGGSGGSIWLQTNSLSGNGIIKANGGNGFDTGGGGVGGGGRIALYCMSSTYAGQILASSGTIGGTIGVEGGTVYIPSSSQSSPIGMSVSTVTVLGTKTLNENLQKKICSVLLNAQGTLSGTVNFTDVQIVNVKSGAFNDKGFIKGNWTATLNGVDYSGTIKGMSYIKGSIMYINSSMESDLGGVLSLNLSGGGYNVVSGSWTFRKAETNGNYTCDNISLTGSISYNTSVDYSGVNISYIQTSAQGTITGGYEGPIQSVLTNVKINDANNPCNGEGFGLMSYKTNKDEGQSWFYSQDVTSEQTLITGMFSSPLLGSINGTLTNKTNEKKLFITLSRIDIGLAPAPILKLDIFGPERLSPGETVTYTARVKNEGTVESSGKMLLILLPVESSFVVGSPGVKYSRPFHVARWSLNNIPARTFYNYTISVKYNWGLPAHLMTDIEARIVDDAMNEQFYNEMEKQYVPQ